MPRFWFILVDGRWFMLYNLSMAGVAHLKMKRNKTGAGGKLSFGRAIVIWGVIIISLLVGAIGALLLLVLIIFGGGPKKKR